MLLYSGRLLLHPKFIAPLLSTEASATRATKRQCARALPAAFIASASSLQDSAALGRHGKAVEPAADASPPSSRAKKDTSGADEPEGGGPQQTVTHVGSAGAASQQPKGKEKASPSVTEKRGKEDLEGGPMEAVLQEGSHSTGQIHQKKPDMVPPPYIHAFDTYYMVKELEKGGFTELQSIELMKAIRFILAINHRKAGDVLVSKSDVENETYLFRAACSELSAEVKNNRKAADEQMRQQRTMLQHEVDILTQTLNQELANLDDGVKNMFNERKMAVKEEQSEIGSAIQQLHLEISAKLSGDAKSDIEGIRWVIMRMAAAGIAFVAILALGMFKYLNETKRVRKEAEARVKKEEEEEEKQRKRLLQQRHVGTARGLVDDRSEVLEAITETLAAN